MMDFAGVEPWLEMAVMLSVTGGLGYLLHNTLMSSKLVRLRTLEVEHSNLHVERAAAAIERDTLRSRGDVLQSERDELSGELEETSARLERTQLALAAFGGDVAVLRRWQEGTDLQLTTLREEIARLRVEAAQIAVPMREATTGRAVVDGLATAVVAHQPANDSARPEPPAPRPVDTFIGRMPDDLTVIMGVDFEVAALLRAAGIRTWSDLARRTPERLRILLASTGGSGAERDPSSWPEQARLATAGRWRQLRQMQTRLAQVRR